MKFILQKQPRLTLYAWQEGDEFLLSTQLEVQHGRRPIQRFDTQQQLEDAVIERGNKVVWIDGQ